MPAQSGFTILAEAILPPLVDQDLDFLGGSDGKASAYNAGDPDLIPGLGRSSGEGVGYHSSILAWRNLWTEETGGLQSIGLQSQT